MVKLVDDTWCVSHQGWQGSVCELNIKVYSVDLSRNIIQEVLNDKGTMPTCAMLAKWYCVVNASTLHMVVLFTQLYMYM